MKFRIRLQGTGIPRYHIECKKHWWNSWELFFGKENFSSTGFSDLGAAEKALEILKKDNQE